MVIIDDDFKSLSRIRNKLAPFEILNIMGTFKDLMNAINFIQNNKVDVVFLDIELANASGLELIEYFDNPSFKIICVTGYQKYAIQAFRKGVFDYLMKPIQDVELKDAINKLQRSSLNKKEHSKNNKPLLNESGQISLLTSKGYEIFDLNTIIRFRATGNYSIIFFSNGESIISARTLKFYDEKLINNNFVRINRQDLVNLVFVKRLLKGRYPLLELSNGETLQVSDRKRKYMRELMAT